MQLLRSGQVRLRSSQNLRRSLAFWALLGFLLSAGLTAALIALVGAADVAWLGAGDCIWWLAVLVFLTGGLSLLRTPQGDPIPYLGVPNGLTAVRAWMIFPLFLCAALPLGDIGFYLWAAVGGTVGMLDFADGYIARRYGPITALGKALDPAMDALFFSSGAVAAYLLQVVPTWLMALIVFRYLAPFLLTPLVFLAGKRPELVHTVWGRRNTALTGAVIFVLMWLRLFHEPRDVAALLLGLLLLVPTTLAHFYALARRTIAAPIAS